MSDLILIGITLVALAIAGMVIAVESELVVARRKDRSDEAARNPTASHPIRLAFLMLLGAALSSLWPPSVGNRLDPWVRFAPLLHAIVGSMIGLCAELYERINDTRTRHKLLLATVICGLLAILWIVIVR